MNDHWNVLYQEFVFYADRKSKMATTAGHRLSLDSMGKCSNAFFSETTNMIKAISDWKEKQKFVEDHPRNIPGKFGSNWPRRQTTNAK
jgi:hypothetical protein